jgi:CubicO group peptidase (beta-lactamase class C family)
MKTEIAIHGTVAPGFEAARDVFAENFAREGDYQEVGASFAVYHRGKCVVDLWGGFADGARTKPWTRETLANVWSSTKGVTATAIAMLVDRGALSYDDAVAKHWPEFAQNGKGGITVAQLLSHQAGLPGFVEPTSLEDMYDWDACCAKLAAQAPAWKPGTASSYHAITYGWLAGEIIRRVSGKMPGQFVADEIASPLDADVFIGLPESEDSRVAEMLAPKHAADIAAMNFSDAAIMALVNPQLDAGAPNARGWRAAQIPSANGQASALGLARVYGALANGGTMDGVKLMSPATIGQMIAPVSHDGRADMLLGFVDAWGKGVILNRPKIYGTNPDAFGHSGWGGSFGCADPQNGVAIGYVCNQMGPDLVGDPRTAGLCAAAMSGASA